MSFPIIDAHQHFWIYDPLRDGWITEEMKSLQRDFLPPDLEPVFNENLISGSVVVQSDQSAAENLFQLNLAANHSFIKGVVGWVDLQSPFLEEQLIDYKRFPKLKGFRHVLQGEQPRDRMLLPAFQRGIGLLNQYEYSYDLLILPDQLAFAEKLVAAFPEQRFVIDHLAKPFIRSGEIAEWYSDILRFAKYPQVYCKISGMVTEADWRNWQKEDFHPYLDAVLDAFGTKRIMFGSDWPVCLLAGSYREMKDIVSDYFSSFTVTEQSDFFSGNAMRFYQL